MSAVLAASLAPASPPPVSLPPETELMIAALAFLNTPADLPRGTSGEANPAYDGAHRRLRAACEALPVADCMSRGPLLDLRIAAEMALRAHRSPVARRVAHKMLSARLGHHTASLRRASDARMAMEARP